MGDDIPAQGECAWINNKTAIKNSKLARLLINVVGVLW